MHFRIQGLPAEKFSHLFTLSDEELARAGAVRQTADGPRPCRISLTDAQTGDELILVNYEHHAVASPYRMRFAIYVRRGEETFDAVELKDDLAHASVRFLAEIRSRTKGPEGEAVDDRRTAEIWTFERNLKSRNPNWTLVHVDAAEA